MIVVLIQKPDLIIFVAFSFDSNTCYLKNRQKKEQLNTNNKCVQI
jgi:hypothetical protein